MNDEKMLARGVANEIFKATGVWPRKHSTWPAFLGYTGAISIFATACAIVLRSV